MRAGTLSHRKQPLHKITARSNTAMSSGCSPVPTNSTGRSSSSAIASTMPPFPDPSSFARNTPAHRMSFTNVRACISPFCPVVASIARITRWDRDTPCRATTFRIF